MKKIILIFASLMLAASVHAIIIDFESSLDGAQANAGAGTGSTATGSATATLDEVSRLFSWNISWSGLLGDITVAHFHGPAAPGSNAGVQVTIDPTTNPSVGSDTITDTQIADLLANLWYINIHSDRNPGGEIRGQVIKTPDSGTTATLLCLGLIGLAALRRRIG